MIPALDFAVFPPEVNSGRMYAGAGAGPMLAAAAAWNALAAELRCTAQCYRSTLAELTGHWHGPTSTAMMAAAAPYVAWLGVAAGRAEHTAAQAEAAVAAYEAAFAATVPPAVVAANRARLMILIATNVLGQNTPAIGATEAEYAEMWAQDAAAMDGYAAASSVATELTPFGPPLETTSPEGLTAQSASVAQAVGAAAGTQQGGLPQTMPNALVGWNPFAPGSASDTTGLNGVLNAIFGTNTAFGQFVNSNILNTVFMPAFYMPSKYLGSMTSLMSVGQNPAPSVAAGAAQGPAGATAGAVGSVGALGDSVSADAGRGALIGRLSVPPSWTSNASAPGPPDPPSVAAPAVVPASQVGSTPGLPVVGGMGAAGDGRAIPQYGFKSRFVARPPAAG